MQSKGTSLFAQILQLIDRYKFRTAVQLYKGDRHVKGFPTWDHFVSMLFCHLAQAKSLREISTGLKSSLGKLSHTCEAVLPQSGTVSPYGSPKSASPFNTRLRKQTSRLADI